MELRPSAGCQVEKFGLEEHLTKNSAVFEGVGVAVVAEVDPRERAGDAVFAVVDLVDEGFDAADDVDQR